MAQPSSTIKKDDPFLLFIQLRKSQLKRDLEELEQFEQGYLGHPNAEIERKHKEPQPTTKVPESKSAEEFTEIRPLKRAKDGLLLGNAYISSSKLVIIPASDVRLEVLTPPFKSFFINRILEIMKNKHPEIQYSIEEKDNLIKKVSIVNYGEKNRLNEIVNTAAWTFTRMLEKK